MLQIRRMPDRSTDKCLRDYYEEMVGGRDHSPASCLVLLCKYQHENEIIQGQHGSTMSIGNTNRFINRKHKI